MAKNKKTNGTWKYYLGVGLTLLLAGGGIIYNHGSQAKAYEQTEKDVIELKIDGCNPSGENTTDIAVIKESLDNIEITQTEMRAEHKEGQKLILEAIKAEK